MLRSGKDKPILSIVIVVKIFSMHWKEIIKFYFYDGCKCDKK